MHDDAAVVCESFCFERCTYCLTLHQLWKHHLLLFGFDTLILNFGIPLHSVKLHIGLCLAGVDFQSP